jgi:hypothetical protein
MFQNYMHLKVFEQAHYKLLEFVEPDPNYLLLSGSISLRNSL